mmetsp:Transcript_14756/g.31655  ORF Transcript_14756/g.31655 Transcript_14756/m.31655 type:complete len:283 (+) Transcript_14756:312-1160(+)
MGITVSTPPKLYAREYAFGETWRLEGRHLDEGEDAEGSVLFMHGLGDTGKGWALLLDKLQLKNRMRIICPTAPIRPVTLKQEDALQMQPKGKLLKPIDVFKLQCKSMPTTCWFDWTPLNMKEPDDIHQDLDWLGIDASVSHVHELLESEVAKGIPSEKIIVGGFSQGGTVALRAALRYGKRLGGVVMLSSFIGPVEDLQRERTPSLNSEIPVFWGHAEESATVPLWLGEMGAQSLQALGLAVEWKTYPGGGYPPASDQQLKDVALFIDRCCTCRSSQHDDLR